ncbi:UDP-N-acetylmuramoyl-tripeptide--D-alanyl-D-alanine ligase [Bacillus tianshenii]|nr:UDP-N-acetylmuramoyl-tripeptide--D-alanyl-D-alanine ligase [Bacillus tianshenii]
MNLTLNDLSTIFSEYKGAGKDNVIIRSVFIDSRKQVEKGLFVPIQGERFDGHEFLKGAIENGAIAALWQKDVEVPAYVPNDFPLYFVADTLTALQELSKFYLQTVQPEVIGITGSNGKTTTKDFIEAVMKKKYRTHKTAGNFNNHIGLPLTILAMPAHTEVLILEMGMNNFGEISFLSTLAKPNAAVITNIGESHLEQLKTREGIAKAKMEIMDGLQTGGHVMIDGDEPLLTTRLHGNKVITCGFGSDNNTFISDVELSETEMTFSLNGEESYTLETLGKHHAKNASYAIVLGKMHDISSEDIQAGLKEVEVTGMRFQREIGTNGVLLINDAYNASPTSMKAAIETVKQIGGYKRYVVVLGDMYELGEQEEALHRSVAEAITEPITHLFTIGEKAKWIADEYKKVGEKCIVHAYNDKDAAFSELQKLADSETVILFKSSRKLALETLVNHLKQS